MILITGVGGYIGPVVVRHLRKMLPDKSLRGIDTGFFLAQQDGGVVAPETFLDEMVFKDVRDLDATDFHGVEAVVHLAAISNDPMGDRFADVTYEINQHQSLRIAQLAKKQGVKSFIFASSGSVYGAGGSEEKSEESVLNPQTAYAKSKMATEELLQQISGPEFLVTSFRFSTACGWSPRVRLDLVLNDFVASAITTGKITVLSDGTPWRPLIHVTDMASAIEWALTERNLLRDHNLVVNVGSADWNFQVKDLAHAVEQALPGTRVSINSDAPADNRSYKVNFDKWKALAPHHQSKRTLSDTVLELSQELSKLNLDKDFRQSRRVRLVTINELKSLGAIDSSLRWSTSDF